MPKTRRRARVSARLKAASKASSGAESCETERETYPTPADHVAASDLSERARALSSSVADKESDVMKLAREFRALCSEHANPSNATAMEQYMRNQFTLFGIKAPQRRKLQKKFTSEHREKLASRPFLLRFAVALWRQEERECQLYGVDLMSEFRREALGETEAEFGEAVACAEVLITTKSWWDTVDMLASHSEHAEPTTNILLVYTFCVDVPRTWSITKSKHLCLFLTGRYGHIHGNDWLENSQKLCKCISGKDTLVKWVSKVFY